MASSFEQYKGGIQPIQGVSEAGARIGQMYQQAFSGLGANLAEGIKAYQSNVAQNDQATEELNQIGQALIKQKQMFGDNPEFSEFGARLDPLIDSVSGAPSKSLSQKLAILNNAKAVIGTTGADFQMYQTLKNAKAQQDMQTAQAGLPTTETIQGGAFIQDGKYGYNPNQDANANDQQFLGAINQMRKLAESRGEKFTVDTASALRNYHKNTILGVQQAQTAGQISAEQAALTIEQLYNADNNLDRQAAGGMYWADQGASPTQSSLAQYQDEKSMSTPIAQTIAERNAPKQEPVGTATPTKNIVESKTAEILKGQESKKAQIAINNERIKMLEEIAQGAFESGDMSAARFALGRFQAKVGSLASGSAKLLEEYGLYTPVSAGPAGVAKLIRNQLPEGSDLMINDIDTVLGKVGISTKALDYLTGEKLSPDKRIEGVNAVREQIKKIKEENASLSVNKTPEEIKASVEAKITPETPKAAPAKELPSTAGVGEIFAGKREAVVPISIEDKKQKLQAHFQKSWGYIPSNFDAIFKSLNPEANLQVMDTKWGPMQWDGKQWNQLDMNKAGYGKPLTTAQQREAVRGVFGQQRQDGSYIPKEIVPNSGIKVGGLFTGTDTALTSFNDLLSNAAPTIKGVERLQEINDMTGESWSGPLRGEASSLCNAIIAGMRTAIIGPGQVSEKELDLLNEIVANPTRFFELESSTRTKLVGLGIRIKDHLKSQAAVNGLTLSIEGSGQATEKNLRTNRLLTK